LSGPSPAAERPATAGLGSQLARWIATVGGLGYAPVAPGTVASLPVALAVWWFRPGDVVLLGVTAAVAVIGIWAAGREEARVGTKDPRAIVVDEVAGMLIACCGQPRTLLWVLGLFLAFRVFDVLKPFGIDRLQALPGGWGVVLDDLLAGVYVSLLGQLRHLV
jgi:phosphatidylglycerophosphatase A